MPLPAESLLILASLYAARTHHLTPTSLLIAAIVGAILGDNIGYLIGHRYGYNLLEKHGRKVGLNEDRLILGRYLFRRFGGVGVFLGRFIAILRIFIALLAGASRMPWPSFLFFNALGGILWSAGYIYITYTLGQQIDHFTGPFGITLGALALFSLGASFFFLKHHEHHLLIKAREDEKRRTPQ